MNCANEAYVLNAQLNARAGIINPRLINMNAGQVIYRFCDSTKAPTPSHAANGAWWMEFEYFQKIKHFAIQHDYSFSYAVRLFAAILYEWSEVDCYVRCEVTQPLRVLKGRGKKVTSTKSDPRDSETMTPMQNQLEIYQLFVPGFGGYDSIALDNLKVLEMHKL